MAAHEPTRRAVSAAELASRLGTSVRTARRVWAEPRAQYEGRSLLRTAPWQSLGVSRATWYRRQRHRQGEETIGQ
jgi:hypothetical protein